MNRKNWKILLISAVALLVMVALIFAMFRLGKGGSDIQYTPDGDSTTDTTEVISSETPESTDAIEESTDATEESTAASQKPVTGATTKPKEKVYTIQYSGLEGATHSNPTTYTAKTAAQVVLKNPSDRPGYRFAGWHVGDTPVTSLAGRTGDLTVTAKWTQQITDGIELPVVPF